MGKKNKKFKKSKPNNNVFVAAPAIEAVGNVVITDTASEVPTINPVAKKVEIANNEIALLNEKYAYVRRDVRKLGIVVASLIIVFVGIYFISIKTTLLTQIGDWIYKVCNIQI